MSIYTLYTLVVIAESIALAIVWINYFEAKSTCKDLQSWRALAYTYEREYNQLKQRIHGDC